MSATGRGAEGEPDRAADRQQPPTEGPEAEATPPPFAAGEAQRYFQAIEGAFVRLRGAPLLLSPADWQVASRWHQDGVPLELVERVLEEVFERRRQRGGRGRISSLRYCAPAVEAAWEEISRLAAAGRGAEAPSFDVRARLEALAGALPESLPERSRWKARILALAGRAEEVEAALAELDREVVERLAAEGGDLGSAGKVEEAVEAALAELRGRLPAEEVAAARARLARQVVRQRWGLPVLSLFSPEAEPAGPAA